ncbi:hypothetical protein [Pseudarthrobacter sp. PS3-L1]|uniref:hypothetical protein n=1 Tax=Pseudarthrobacter sp. PS3-L1 TaxID=3046207 RepID=UPI0024BBD46B|nr:hypothetical protein [Pseudarthrobacter sp. PS3-L1]MDJ0319180.1 hypothetical protein [Pseudarthrobacter sp. PS3-L1]
MSISGDDRSTPDPGARPEPGAQPRRRVRALLFLVPAVALIAIGIGGFLMATETVSFGWFAYAPLSDTAFSPDSGLRIVGPQARAGLVVLIVGVVTLAFWGGFRLGLHGRSTPD